MAALRPDVVLHRSGTRPRRRSDLHPRRTPRRHRCARGLGTSGSAVRRAATVVLLGLLALAACSSDKSASDTTSASAATTAPSATTGSACTTSAASTTTGSVSTTSAASATTTGSVSTTAAATTTTAPPGPLPTAQLVQLTDVTE